MATGLSLVMRAIQPHAGQARSIAEPNGHRRESRAAAKAQGITRRRYLKAQRKASRHG